MLEFAVGENAVYPNYGVGTIVAIESKQFAGATQAFYVITFSDSGMKVMVPTDKAEEKGLRKIISKKEASKVLDILKVTEVKADNQTWNRRYREYMERIKTGSVYEIAAVLRDLHLLKVDKDLSFGERKMLDKARTLLLRELSLATSQEALRKEKDIAAIFGLDHAQSS